MHIYLDIEFALTREGDIKILQARPVTTFFNWTDWATHKINVADHKAAVLKAIKIEEASDFHSYLSVPFPPFHQFILAALSQTEILLDEKYTELFGDRSEISLGITQ